VLRGLDLELPRACVLALFGPNGAGKTTLVRILAGLSSPGGGSVEILGQNFTAGASLRRKIGVVAHEPFLYGDLTARENLEHYSRLYSVDDSRIDGLLERVGIRAAAERRVRAFSRGMIQRLSLARATLHEPELLLLDEPFTGLDPQGADALSTLIREERDRGTAVLMTTHDFQRGLAVADRAAILADGRMAWSCDDGAPAPEAMAEIYASAIRRR
jgi:heme exporter protein A